MEREISTIVKRMLLAKALVRCQLDKFPEIKELGYNGIVYNISDEQVEDYYARIFGVKEEDAVENQTSGADADAAETFTPAISGTAKATATRKINSAIAEVAKRVAPYKSVDNSTMAKSLSVGCFSGINWYALKMTPAEVIPHVRLESKYRESIEDAAIWLCHEVLKAVGSTVDAAVTLRDLASFSLVKLVASEEFGVSWDYRGYGGMWRQPNFLCKEPMNFNRKSGVDYKRFPKVVEKANVVLNIYDDRDARGYSYSPNGIKKTVYIESPRIYFGEVTTTGDEFIGAYMALPLCDAGFDMAAIARSKVAVTSPNSRSVPSYAEQAAVLNRGLQNMCKANVPLTQYVVLLPLTLDEAISLCEVIGLDTSCDCGKFGSYADLHRALCLVREHQQSLLNAMDAFATLGGIVL